MGAKVIEKHFILNKKIKSHDKKFSYGHEKFKKLITKIRRIEKILGSENINKKKILKRKLKTITRSIFYIRNIKKGQRINESSIKSVRPGVGLPLKYYDRIIGKKTKKDCFRGQPVQKKDF
jgi:pseudaminic acid synthase